MRWLVLLPSLILVFGAMPGGSYEPAVDWAVGRAWLPPVAAVGAVAVALGAGSTLGAEFAPHLDEGSIAMQTVRLSSVSLEKSVEMGDHVERVLMQRFPDEIETIIGRMGRPEIATDPMGVEVTDVCLMLAPRGEWRRASSKSELVAQVKRSRSHRAPAPRFNDRLPR